MIRGAPRVKAGERIVHAETEWRLFEPDALPPGRFALWAVIAKHDDDNHTVCELLGSGTGRAVQHSAIVRSATWAATLPAACVRVGAADPASVRSQSRLGSACRR
jgi:hypothetical protein